MSWASRSSRSLTRVSSSPPLTLPHSLTVKRWSPTELGVFLRSTGILSGSEISFFEDELIDGDTFLDLTIIEIETKLGIKKFGPQKRLFKLIRTICDSGNLRVDEDSVHQSSEESSEVDLVEDDLSEYILSESEDGNNGKVISKLYFDQDGDDDTPTSIRHLNETSFRLSSGLNFALRPPREFGIFFGRETLVDSVQASVSQDLVDPENVFSMINRSSLHLPHSRKVQNAMKRFLRVGNHYPVVLDEKFEELLSASNISPDCSVGIVAPLSREKDCPVKVIIVRNGAIEERFDVSLWKTMAYELLLGTENSPIRHTNSHHGRRTTRINQVPSRSIRMAYFPSNSLIDLTTDTMQMINEKTEKSPFRLYIKSKNDMEDSLLPATLGDSDDDDYDMDSDADLFELELQQQQEEELKEQERVILRKNKRKASDLSVGDMENDDKNHEDEEDVEDIEDDVILSAMFDSHSKHRKAVSREEMIYLLHLYIGDYEDRWQKRKLPCLEQKAFKIYKSYRFHRDGILRELERLETQLAKFKDAALKESAGSYTSLKIASRNLEPIVCNKKEMQWTLGLVDGPPPLKPTIPRQPPSSKRPATKDSDIDMTNFMVDFDDENLAFLVEVLNTCHDETQAVPSILPVSLDDNSFEISQPDTSLAPMDIDMNGSKQPEDTKQNDESIHTGETISQRIICTPIKQAPNNGNVISVKPSSSNSGQPGTGSFCVIVISSDDESSTTDQPTKPMKAKETSSKINKVCRYTLSDTASPPAPTSAEEPVSKKARFIESPDDSTSRSPPQPKATPINEIQVQKSISGQTSAFERYLLYSEDPFGALWKAQSDCATSDVGPDIYHHIRLAAMLQNYAGQARPSNNNNIWSADEEFKLHGIHFTSQITEHLIDEIENSVLKRTPRFKSASTVDEDENDDELWPTKGGLENYSKKPSGKVSDKRAKIIKSRNAIQSRKTAARGTIISRPGMKKQVIVNLGHAEDEDDILLDGFLADYLNDHQIEGLQFLWVCCCMSSSDGDIVGGILAHPCGIGKTLTTISFLWTLAKNVALFPSLQERFQFRRFLSILVIVPSNLVNNWLQEFTKWINPDELIETFGQEIQFLTATATFKERAEVIQRWKKRGGILLMSYTLFRMMCDLNPKPKVKAKVGDMETDAKRKAMADEVRAMLQEGPSVVVCDEAHKLKSSATKITQAINQIKTRHRVALTGTPLQNNVLEYYSMVDWVAPGLLGDMNEFKEEFDIPIKQGMYADASFSEQKSMRIQMRVLNTLIEQFIHRPADDVFLKLLPPQVTKTEWFVKTLLSPVQHAIYTEYMDVNELNSSSDRNLLEHEKVLNLICNHPNIFKGVIEGRADKAMKLRAKKVELETKNGSCSEVEKRSSFLGIDKYGEDVNVVGGLEREEEGEGVSDNEDPYLVDSEVTETLEMLETEKQRGFVNKNFAGWEISEALELSNKMNLVFKLIRAGFAVGDKLLIFSHSIPTLEYVQSICLMKDIPSVLITGKTPMPQRTRLIDEFERSKEPQVFLLSSRASSEGINLTSANRVVILDCGWNPTIDEQSVGRCFRLGQLKPVFVYRLMTAETIEDRKSSVNQHKKDVSNIVVDKVRFRNGVLKEQTRGYFMRPSMLVPLSKNAPEFARVVNVCRARRDSVFEAVLREYGQCVLNVQTREEVFANLMLAVDETSLVKTRVQEKMQKAAMKKLKDAFSTELRPPEATA